MKKYLQDIVRCTSGLEFGVVKVEGNDKETKYQSVSDDRTVIVSATANEVVDDFKGVFGLSNLALLGGLTGSKSFKGDDATVTVSKINRDGKDIPAAFVFDNDSGMHGVYRLMSEQAIPNQPKFTGTTYAIEIDEPAKQKITEFAEIATLYSATEEKFTPKIVDDNLIFAIGDENSASHSASVMFQKDVGTAYKGGFSWPTSQVLTILKLAESGDSSLSLSNDGVMKVDVDTGISKWEFLLPGHTV